MARTKQVAWRPSTGGPAPKKRIITSCGRNNRIPAVPHYPYSSDGWTSVTCGKRYKVHQQFAPDDFDRSDAYSDEYFILPSLIAISKIIAPSQSQQVRESMSTKRKQPRDNLATKLPTEILLQIFEPFVSTGGVYHFTMIENRRAKGVKLSIFEAMPSEEYDEHVDRKVTIPTTLALVCRQFKEISYSLFYGRNDFVIELASRPLTSCIEALDDTKNPYDWVGVTRIMDLPASGLPWPLTAETSRHITDLTVVIVLSSRCPTAEERLYLQQQTDILEDLIGHEEGAALRRLAIDVSVREAWPGQFVAKRLSLVRIPWNGAEPSRMHMAIKDLSEPPTRLRGGENARQIAASLLKLLDPSQVSLSGLLQ